MKKQPPTYVRFAETGPDPEIPTPLEMLSLMYSRRAKVAAGAGELHFSLPMLPKSVNHQYIVHGKRRDLDPEYKRLRDETWARLATVKGQYVPKGVLAILLCFRSPSWITKAQTVRDVDVDNKIKPMLDSVALGLGISDSLVWDVHAFKQVGPEDKTVISLYDLGDIVVRPNHSAMH